MRRDELMFAPSLNVKVRVFLAKRGKLLTFNRKIRVAGALGGVVSLVTPNFNTTSSFLTFDWSGESTERPQGRKCLGLIPSGSS